MSVPSPRHIVITGASSGIGAALAIHYAKANRRRTICGRDLARLTEIAEACRNLGAEVDASVVDVGDRQACRDWLERAWQSQPVDLLIANAGVDGSAYEGDEVYYGVTDINYLGTLNSVLPILGRMKQIGAGRIALVGSLAGYRGLPSAVAYSASKAAVRALGDGLRGRYARDGIRISVISPGFVESRITASNPFPMPMLWPAEKAARYIARKLDAGKGRIAFPWPLHAACWLLQTLPASLTDGLLTRAPRKQR